MFAAQKRQKEMELTTLIAFFDLIQEIDGKCIVKKTVLQRKQINLVVIQKIFDKLDVDYFETEASFTVKSDLESLVNLLDDFYPDMFLGQEKAAAHSAAAVAQEDTHESHAYQVIEPEDPAKTIFHLSLQSYSGSLPLWGNELQQEILLQYIRESFEALQAKRPDENTQSFAARIRLHTSQKARLEHTFKLNSAGMQIAVDDAEVPLIFSLIKAQFKPLEKQNKITFIQTVIALSEAYLHELADLELQQLYLKVLQVLDTLEIVRKNIGYFCTRASIASDLIQIRCEITEFSESRNILQSLVFFIQAPNEAIGYSLHNILIIAEIIENRPYGGSSENRFDAPVVYSLTYAELKLFESYLGDLSVWYRDFENILSALFASDASAYVKTGKKPLREAVITEVVREREGLETFMETDVRTRFAEHPDEDFLLFAQTAIDLTLHPKRNEMRELIQSIYSKCQLEDSKKEAKTFVKDAMGQLSYLSLLSVGHIRAIYDEIMALSSLTKTAEEMGLTVFDYIQLMAAGDAKDLYHQYLQLLLIDILSENTVNEINETKISKRRKIESTIGSTFTPPAPHEDFMSLSTRFHKTLENKLNTTMDIICNPAIPKPDLSPTAIEIHALVCSAPYTSANAKSNIENDMMLDYSFAKIKASPHYAILATGYERYFQSLKAFSRIPEPTEYSEDSIYLFPNLDSCLAELQAQFKHRIARTGGRYVGNQEIHYAIGAWQNIVMKVVYASKMQIPENALIRAATRFADTFKIDGGRDDLGKGCDIGLAGRCLNIDSQLISGEENLFTQFIRQKLIDDVEEAFNCTIGSSQQTESSMAARAKPYIVQILGLQHNTSGRDTSRTANIPQFMQELATRYNPGLIFKKSYEYICDDYKRCIRDGDDEGMFTLLRDLGYVPERDATIFQIDGKWNIKLFESLLPTKLVSFLISKNVFQPGVGCLRMVVDNSNYSFTAAIASKEAAIRRSRIALPAPFYAARPASSVAVNLQGDSRISQASGTGSIG